MRRHLATFLVSLLVSTALFVLMEGNMGISLIRPQSFISDGVGYARVLPSSHDVEIGQWQQQGVMGPTAAAVNPRMGLHIPVGATRVELQASNQAAINLHTDGRAVPVTNPQIAFIAETLLTAQAASVTFSNIPQTYRHLKIEYMIRAWDLGGAGSSALIIRFNGDAGANYDTEAAIFIGAAVAPGDAIATVLPSIGQVSTEDAPAGYFAPGTIEIPYYANSVTNKAALGQSAHSRSNLANDQRLTHNYVKWRTVGIPITSITIFAVTGNLMPNSLLSLYGLP